MLQAGRAARKYARRIARAGALAALVGHSMSCTALFLASLHVRVMQRYPVLSLKHVCSPTLLTGGLLTRASHLLSMPAREEALFRIS